MDLNQSLFSMYVSRKLSKIVERIQYKKTINVSVRKKDVGQTLHGQMKLYLAFSRPCEMRVGVGGRSPDDPSAGTLRRLLASGPDGTRQSLIWQEVSQTAIIIEIIVLYLSNHFFSLKIWQMTQAHRAHGIRYTSDMPLGLLCQVSSARYKTLTHWVSTDTSPGASGKADQGEGRPGVSQNRRKADQEEVSQE